MPEEQLTFKETCATFDVTPRALRFYAYIALLAPTREGRARCDGRFLDLHQKGDGQHARRARTMETAKERLRDMEWQRARLDAASAGLREQMQWAGTMLEPIRKNSKPA